LALVTRFRATSISGSLDKYVRDNSADDGDHEHKRHDSNMIVAELARADARRDFSAKAQAKTQ
jgi:hypothetical protein